MAEQHHIILNALSATGAGNFTVARNLAHELPLARPGWRFTVLLVGGHALHDQIQPDELPPNCGIRRAPAAAEHRVPRLRYERKLFPDLARQGASATLQLNGMMPPAGKVPALAHNGDPWPYRPEAWGRPLYDPVLAFLRRRVHRRAFKHAACVGFTSNYIRELMTQRLGLTPRHARVFYNGLPEEWIERARRPLPDYAGRPMEIISVSSISPYKRQELVVRAMPELVKRPGMDKLLYRIVGHHYSDAYIEGLKKMASDLGVGSRVIFEGRLPDERMQELLTRARAFVLMSVCESFGIPAIEAMSHGTPVVTSDCCAMPEVCGKGAMLSPVDDVGSLVENLYRVLSDRGTAERLRLAGAANCLRFSWANTAEQMASEFERIISGGS